MLADYVANTHNLQEEELVDWINDILYVEFDLILEVCFLLVSLFHFSFNALQWIFFIFSNYPLFLLTSESNRIELRMYFLFI